ncbi:hypothetical protein [Streptomyces lydicus]|uniref:hypothetical protein n=1 Tax=Streptomyces lydicus TaxID=47763 RepID=UPI0010124FC7|nr:hypothetical protein [Streptomyces lydicus]MCZ1009436.1 hypothetical protein [Streptomyces lydicus]
MTQGQIYGLVTFLAVVAVMLVRSNEVKAWQAIAIALGGFYLALTPMGYMVTWIVNLIAKAL